MPQVPTIAIIGAGPAGLTLANILQRHGWRADVFEADAAIDARDQGGSLDLHPGQGQRALAQAGLLDAFMAVARHEDQETRLVHHATGAVLREEIPAAGMGERPEIDRLALRQLLLRPLDAGTVRWGRRLEDVIPRADGRHGLRCAGGEMGPYDLVIGADGAWSRVRAALTPAQPVYCGVTFVELWLHDVDRRHPEAAARVGHGTMFSRHRGNGIVAQRNGNATVRVYAALRTGPQAGSRPDPALAGIGKDALLARFAGWSPSLLALIAEADRIAAVRPIVSLPAGTRWPHRTGLTAVGDAAHVMRSLGVGVNLAMQDAAELAEALVSGDDWRAAQRRSEAAMLDRAAAVATQCIESLDELFDNPQAQAPWHGHEAHHDDARPGP